MNFPVPSRSYLSDFQAYVGNYVDTFTRFWNNHNQGKLAWDNVTATTASIGALTSTTSTVLKGTTTNDSAAAGNIGESFYSAVASQNFPASNVIGDGTSVTLTAGDWDVTALMFAQVVALTTNVLLGISITSGNSATGLSPGDNRLDIQTGGATGTDSLSVPNWRLSIASTTTTYLKVQSTYTGTTPTYFCRLSARRMR